MITRYYEPFDPQEELEFLQSLEWGAMTEEGELMCPCCGYTSDENHAEECGLHLRVQELSRGYGHGV